MSPSDQAPRGVVACAFCSTLNRVDLTKVSHGPKCANCHRPILLDRPIMATNVGPSLAFFADSAFDTVQVTNRGGQPLVLQSIGLAGASPASFQFFTANRGFSNCFNGIPLSPNGNCYLGVGPVAGAAVPSSAQLVILSNDPVNPELDILLDLTTPPPPP